jgi:hypothetical protein
MNGIRTPEIDFIDQGRTVVMPLRNDDTQIPIHK